MSTFVVTPCFTDGNAFTKCCLRPTQKLQQERGLCLGRKSTQLFLVRAIPLRSSPLGVRRGFFRRSRSTQRSFPGGPRADFETDERPSRADGNGRTAGGLEELDNQLRVLSSSDNLLPAARGASKGDTEKLPRKESKKVNWPVFGDGFVLYVSVGLLLLTIVNNVLFRIFIGPPVSPREPRPQGTEVPQVRRERYKLRSYSDPKFFESAPSVTDEPLS